MHNPKSVLIICTGNSCRSQMAEALLRQMAGPRLKVQSAGSHPAGYIHGLAIETMRQMGVPMDDQYSKSWDEVAGERHDIIITVCDHAATCPMPPWTGQPAVVHWSLPDPSYAPGGPEYQLAAAERVARALQGWFQQMLDLPLEDMRPEQLHAALQQIATL